MRSEETEDRKKALKLSKLQRQVLVGLLLGDAHLETENGGRTYRLKIEQSARHEAYVRHLHSIFEEWVLTPPRRRNIRRGAAGETQNLVFATLSHASFRFYAHQFYAEGRKRVPKLIHRWLDDRALAYWFMDDGSMESGQSKGVILDTQGFERSNVERLVKVLGGNFGLKASLRRQKDGYEIYISGESYERFVELVGPYVIPEMAYKLPPPRRTRLPKR